MSKWIPLAKRRPKLADVHGDKFGLVVAFRRNLRFPIDHHEVLVSWRHLRSAKAQRGLEGALAGIDRAQQRIGKRGKNRDTVKGVAPGYTHWTPLPRKLK